MCFWIWIWIQPVSTGFRSNRSGKPLPEGGGLTGSVGIINPDHIPGTVPCVSRRRLCCLINVAATLNKQWGDARETLLADFFVQNVWHMVFHVYSPTHYSLLLLLFLFKLLLGIHSVVPNPLFDPLLPSCFKAFNSSTTSLKGWNQSSSTSHKR